MSLIKTPLEKAIGALEICNHRLADFEAERAAKAGQVDATADFDAGFALREELAVLDRKIEAATVARDHAAGQVERAQAEAAQAEADRRHAAAQKLARAGEKLTLDVVAAVETLVERLAALEANRDQVEEANAVRGNRDFIVDGETRLRRPPPREVPAVTVRDTVWIAADGSRPSQYRDDGTGRMIPADHRQYEFREVETVVRPARLDPGIMPPRLADEIRLVDLHGRQIWPRK